MEFEFAKLSSTCRACLSKDGPFLDNEDILQIFSKITQVNFEELPRVICLSCSESLKCIEKFIQLCKASDEFIRAEILKLSVGIENAEEIRESTEETERLDKEEIGQSSDEIESQDEEEIEDSNEETEYLDEETGTNVQIEGMHVIVTEPEEESKPKARKRVSFAPDPIIKTKKRSYEFMCGTCNKIFPSLKLRKQHHDASSTCKDNQYKCPECDKIFVKRYMMLTHLHCHTKEELFQCETCMKPFRHKSNLTRHRHLHNIAKPNQCNVCLKVFTETSPKERHTCTLHSTTCRCCGINFENYDEIRRHLTERLIQESENLYDKFECNECDEKFANKPALSAHKSIHRSDRKFVCNFCGKLFRTKSNMQYHLRRHSGEKPYKCSHCDKSFVVLSALKKHAIAHSGERRFACELCDKTFMHSTYLKQHMSVHTGVRPHVCQYCDKKFSTKGGLTLHIRIHTGETPYRCSVCEKGFYHASNWKRHERLHVGTTNGLLENSKDSQENMMN